MFKVRSFRVIFAMAALSLSACKYSNENDGVKFNYNKPDTYTVKCTQSGTLVIDVVAANVYTYSGGVEGTTVDGNKFAVQSAACMISKNKKGA